MTANVYYKKQDKLDFSTTQFGMKDVEKLINYVGDENIDKVKLFENDEFKTVLNKYFSYLCDNNEQKYIETVKLYLGLIAEYLDVKSKDFNWTLPINEVICKYLECCLNLKYLNLPYRFINTVSFNADIEVPVSVNQKIYLMCFKLSIIHGNYQLAYEYILAYFSCITADEKVSKDYNVMYQLFVLMNICMFGRAKSLPHFLSKSLTQELSERNENILIFCENYENHVINLDNLKMLEHDIEVLNKSLNNNDEIFNQICKYILEERYIIDCILHCSYCFISMRIETFLERIGVNIELFNKELDYMKANNMVSFTIDHNFIKFNEIELDDVLIPIKKEIGNTEDEYLRIKNKIDDILSTELIAYNTYEEEKKKNEKFYPTPGMVSGMMMGQGGMF